MRVQIPAYTDRWMMGDRYGTVIKTTVLKGTANRLDPTPGRYRPRQLDVSGKTMNPLRRLHHRRRIAVMNYRVTVSELAFYEVIVECENDEQVPEP